MAKVWWLGLLSWCACGGGGNHSHPPDAATADAVAASDAAPDADTSAPVVIRVSHLGAPKPGVIVVFQNSDSSLVTMMTTQGDGLAGARMDPGGFVSVIDAFVPDDDPPGVVEVFAGVKPGDQLVLDDLLGGSAGAGMATITIPLDRDPRVDHYIANGHCFYGGLGTPHATTYDITAYLHACSGASTILVASVTAEGHLVHWFYVPDLAIADQASLDLTGQTYTAPITRTFTYTNLPPELATPYATDEVIYDNTILFAGSEVATGTPPTAAVAIPDIPSSRESISTRADNLYGAATELAWGPPSATYPIDFASRMLPLYEGKPSYDIANHRVSWAASTTSTTPDFVQVWLTAGNKQWRMIAPYANPLPVPVLPSVGIPNYNFQPGDTIAITRLLAVQISDGYDAVRGRITPQQVRLPDALRETRTSGVMSDVGAFYP